MSAFVQAKSDTLARLLKFETDAQYKKDESAWIKECVSVANSRNDAIAIHSRHIHMTNEAQESVTFRNGVEVANTPEQNAA
jgi:hypothetical protein